jgi:hypothetical protein
MLTATDLPGEETQEKKNPKFLLLILAIFIMAGIGYTAFLWVFERGKISPEKTEQIEVDANAQAWYDEQKKLMENRMSIQSVQDSSAVNMVPVTIDPSTTTEAIAVPVIEKPAVVVAKPSEYLPRKALRPQIKNIPKSDYIERPVNKIITAPKQNNKKVEAFFIPRQNSSKIIEANQSIEINEKKNNKVTSSSSNSQITNEELERFMRLFPNKKTYIQFIGYTKPTAEMDATKNYIVQFLRQNGYLEVTDQWNFWYDHTAIQEVHYGQSGANGANFYIPSFR